MSSAKGTPHCQAVELRYSVIFSQIPQCQEGPSSRRQQRRIFHGYINGKVRGPQASTVIASATLLLGLADNSVSLANHSQRAEELLFSRKAYDVMCKVRELTHN